MKEIDCRTGANTSFFALFTLALSSGPGARDTRDAWGASSAAGCKRNFKKPNKGSMFLFRWVYFLSKVNVKNRIKIRDSMLTWRKRVTDFRSHAKGHTILCDVYYQPTNDWSDERFSKSKSFLSSPDWSKNSKIVTLASKWPQWRVVTLFRFTAGFWRSCWADLRFSFGFKLWILWIKTTQEKLEITFLTVKTC